MSMTESKSIRSLAAILALCVGGWALTRFQCTTLVRVTSFTSGEQVQFELSNSSGSPVEILGILAGCDCVSLENVPDYPTVLAPGQVIRGSARVRSIDDPTRIPGIVLTTRGQGKSFHAFERTGE